MKKLLVILIATLGLSVGSAQGFFGIYLLGVQYTLDVEPEVRFGVGFPIFLEGGGLISGTVDVLFPMTPNRTKEQTQGFLGAGTGVNFAFGGGNAGLLITPRAFGNVEFGGGFYLEGGLQGFIGIGGGNTQIVNAILPYFRLGWNFR